jgi:hypothetical protein
MKPKARYYPALRGWIVWDGVSFRNGFSQAKFLEDAYRYYINGHNAINCQQIGRMFRATVVIDFSKTFIMERSYEPK